jgi:hypothetical protein
LGRQLRYAQRFLSNAASLAPGRSQAWREVVRVAHALARAGTLPAPGDVFAILPPSTNEQVQLLAHGRQVPGRSLWVWYQTMDGEVLLVALTRAH